MADLTDMDDKSDEKAKKNNIAASNTKQAGLVKSNTTKPTAANAKTAPTVVTTKEDSSGKKTGIKPNSKTNTKISNSIPSKPAGGLSGSTQKSSGTASTSIANR